MDMVRSALEVGRRLEGRRRGAECADFVDGFLAVVSPVGGSTNMTRTRGGRGGGKCSCGVWLSDFLRREEFLSSRGRVCGSIIFGDFHFAPCVPSRSVWSGRVGVVAI